MVKFYNINGIPSDQSNEGSIVLEWNNTFSITENDNTTELDFKLIGITHRLADRMFGSVQKFYEMLPGISMVFPYAGIDSDIKVSKTDFENWVKSDKSEMLHKLLYYYDFRNLVGSLQNLVSESRTLFCDFYKALNENTFMLADKPFKPDMVMFASGMIVTSIFSRINHLFINLASQLDFITKIFVEFENLPADYTEYPRLKSNSILYGDAKKVKGINTQDTLFERTNDIKLILSFRNEIVHNASFENNPKVHQVFEKDAMVEKFIYVPDYTAGNFDAYKNRTRFFNNEEKLNEILPGLVTGFWKKMENTVDRLTGRAESQV
jgi:hypothetical protein